MSSLPLPFVLLTVAGWMTKGHPLVTAHPHSENAGHIETATWTARMQCRLERLRRVLGLALGVACSAACSPVADSGDHNGNKNVTTNGVTAQPALCERSGQHDVVRDVFCKEATNALREITSLAELYAALGLPSPVGAKRGDDAGAALLAHSTALDGHLVSELNPRAILASPGLFVAFTRGVQAVEIAARDRSDESRLTFYLLTFQQRCNHASDGCGPGDLFTPRIEAGWQQLALADDEDLKNTASDCRQCHQRASTRPQLLMRELYSPWTHYFGPDQAEPKNFPEPTGSALLRDYLRAKGDEPYAGISTNVLASVSGLLLEVLVGQAQPLVFDGATILAERWPWHDGAYAPEPARSATWDEAFAAFKRAEQLPLPFYAPRASDPAKQARLTEAYQRYRAGELDAAELPDLSDIFPDDPQLRAEIGLQTEPSASPAQTLIQACGACHNDVLDQSLSRARFSIALGRMSRSELDLAVARVMQNAAHAGVMPPQGRRQIAPDNVMALVEYLQRDARPADDDALLERAARLGMAGAAKRYP